MKPFFLFIIVLGLSCKSGQHRASAPKDFVFTGLTFLSSRCNGTCPAISMNLYDDRRIELSRAIFKGKGALDSAASGNFKGSLSKEAFDKVVDLMEAVNWDTVAFPKVLCCDRPVVTLLFSYNGNYKRFKSITPPAVTDALVKYLTSLGATIALPRYGKPIDFEDFDL